MHHLSISSHSRNDEKKNLFLRKQNFNFSEVNQREFFLFCLFRLFVPSRISWKTLQRVCNNFGTSLRDTVSRSDDVSLFRPLGELDFRVAAVEVCACWWIFLHFRCFCSVLSFHYFAWNRRRCCVKRESSRGILRGLRWVTSFAHLRTCSHSRGELLRRDYHTRHVYVPWKITQVSRSCDGNFWTQTNLELPACASYLAFFFINARDFEGYRYQCTFSWLTLVTRQLIRTFQDSAFVVDVAHDDDSWPKMKRYEKCKERNNNKNSEEKFAFHVTGIK